MDDISALLKEAKPLYFARKKRNKKSAKPCSSADLLLEESR